MNKKVIESQGANATGIKKLLSKAENQNHPS